MLSSSNKYRNFVVRSFALFRLFSIEISASVFHKCKRGEMFINILIPSGLFPLAQYLTTDCLSLQCHLVSSSCCFLLFLEIAEERKNRQNKQMQKLLLRPLNLN